MENKEKDIDKAAATLTKELEGMSGEGLHDFFMFFYKLNHRHYPAYKNGQLNVSELARVCDMRRTTVYKYIEILK